MTLSIFLDSSINEDKVNAISHNIGINAVTEIPTNEPFLAFKENGLNFFF